VIESLFIHSQGIVFYKPLKDTPLLFATFSF